MRSSAWLFFDKTADPAVARCSLCGTSIKSYSSTTNLLKHLRSRHFEETSAEINWDNSAGDNADQLVDDSSVADVSELTEIPSVDGESDEVQLPVEDMNALLSSVSSIRSNRSPAWYCFTPFKGKNLAKCKFCHMSFRYNKTGSTSSLVHHFALKHNDIYLKVVAEVGFSRNLGCIQSIKMKLNKFYIANYLMTSWSHRQKGFAMEMAVL